MDAIDLKIITLLQKNALDVKASAKLALSSDIAKKSGCFFKK